MAPSSKKAAGPKVNFDRPIGNTLLHGDSQKALQDVIAQLQPASFYRMFVSEGKELAESLEERAKVTGNNTLDLSHQIGMALNDMVEKRGISIVECMKKWDKNQDGQFSKNEFRTGVRAPINSSVNFGLGVECETHAIDEYFDRMVANGKGGLSVNRQRMTVLLKELMAGAQNKFKEDEQLTAQVAEHHERATSAQQMVEQTELAEAELRRLRSKWDEQCPVEAKVGIAMVRCQMKVADIRRKFNDAGDDLISKKEWEKHIKADLKVPS